ncbi:MAG: hypothetical protein Q8K36_01755, partial [Alphaproteobacteria bacterium]|nr:hypothetical protein [Alphaproteobacteria bacterium]
MKQVFIPLSALLCGLVFSGCSDLVQRSSLHPQQHREGIKDIARPASHPDVSGPTHHQRKLKPKEEVIPKVLLKPVSISITEQTPMKEVIITLAEQAGVDLQLSRDVDVSMNYTAKHKPFYHVLRQICDLGDLRLIRDGTSIRIEADKPYSKNYNVQFLNIERQSQNRISVATDVFTQQGKANGNLDNGSNSEVTVQGSNHFWSEIESNIKTILSHTQQQGQFSIHKQAGIIAIYATQKQHAMIQEYLDQIKFNTSRQVLVEAKIIEVTLKDGFKSG